MQPVQWCFFMVGCVSYRGYFAKEDAEAFAAETARQGHDVYVGPVPAYSTLGYFTDPVLNTFIHYPDYEIARLLFHELSHQVVYVRDDTVFNESFAVAVEQEGVRRWLARSGGRASSTRRSSARSGYARRSCSSCASTGSELARSTAAISRPKRCARARRRSCARSTQEYQARQAAGLGRVTPATTRGSRASPTTPSSPRSRSTPRWCRRSRRCSARRRRSRRGSTVRRQGARGAAEGGTRELRRSRPDCARTRDRRHEEAGWRAVSSLALVSLWLGGQVKFDIERRRANLPRPTLPRRAAGRRAARGDRARDRGEPGRHRHAARRARARRRSCRRSASSSGRGVAGMIGHTQPRRIAARTVAARIARSCRARSATPSATRCASPTASRPTPTSR